MYRKLSCAVIATVLTLCVCAQTRKLSGKISDQNNKPVSGATVSVKGSKTTTVAGDDGIFSINIPDKDNTILVFGAVGFELKEAPAGKTNFLQITLRSTTKALEDVVVVGYGTSKKKDLTGAVASVSMTDVDKTPVVGTEQLLQGQISGVQVTQVNSQPGSSFSVRIRGTNSINSSNEPLYVVDGFAGADISIINANDIATMDVLKDASATAIYGSRGANGVVIITTKRGASGKSAVTFDMYYGYQQVKKMFDMMNAPQFATYLNQVAAANASTPIYTPDQIKAMGNGTNWQKEIFRLAPISNYTLGFSGGDANSKHYLSFNFFDQQGIIINSGYKRGVMRFNLDKKISDKLKIGLSSSIAYSYQNKANVNTNGGSAGGTILDALRMNPAVPVKDSNGLYTYTNYPSPPVELIGNPVAAALYNTDRISNLRTFANFFAEYEIIKGLKFKTALGGNYRAAWDNQFLPTTTYLGSQTVGYASKIDSTNYNWLNENTLTYDKEFNKIHAINIVGGFTIQDFKMSTNTSATTGLQTNNLGNNNLAVGQNVITPTSNIVENTLVSYFTRVNYRLMDRYLFTFTMRADGSSRFGAGNKWGYFPSGAFAWRVSDENFMKNIKAISDLKLRTSYGVTGNQEIGSYNALAQYSATNYTAGGANSGTTAPQVGFYPANIANPGLSWESTASFDMGVDLGILNNRITFTADYYYKKTSNLLLWSAIPSSSGYTKLLKNVGSVQNQGFEFAVNTTNISNSKVKWTTSLNFSTNRNKILNLGGQNNVPIGNVSTSIYPGAGKFFSSILQIGQPVGSFYGYVFDGIWQSQDQITKSGTKQPVKPGDPIYKDFNGDSTLSAADQRVIGHASPKFTFGFTSNLTVGRFNLFVMLQGVQGDNILNENLLEAVNGITTTNKQAFVATQSWTGPGTSNTLPSVSSVYRRGLGVVSDLIENGSYLRFKTITLSYDVPFPKLTNGVFKSASVYVTAQNLITITKYSGYDPEVGSYGLDGTSLNTDYNPYPNVRTFLAGVKFGF